MKAQANSDLASVVAGLSVGIEAVAVHLQAGELQRVDELPDWQQAEVKKNCLVRWMIRLDALPSPL